MATRVSETTRTRRMVRTMRSQDASLPIENYRNLRIDEIIAKVNALKSEDIRKIMNFERKNKNRQTLLNKLKQRLH
jgi:hypothetical protein